MSCLCKIKIGINVQSLYLGWPSRTLGKRLRFKRECMNHEWDKAAPQPKWSHAVLVLVFNIIERGGHMSTHLSFRLLGHTHFQLWVAHQQEWTQVYPFTRGWAGQWTDSGITCRHRNGDEMNDSSSSLGAQALAGDTESQVNRPKREILTWKKKRTMWTSRYLQASEGLP